MVIVGNVDIDKRIQSGNKLLGKLIFIKDLEEEASEKKAKRKQ